MPDRKVTITVSAKNLTEAEFKKVRKGLGGIGKSAGGAKQKTSGLSRAFSSFGKAAPGALKAVTIGAGLAGAAIVGVTAAVIKLGERGAMIGDVKEAFDKLSAATGETGAVMLGALAQGVKGTLTNFELMKVANKALGTGLLKSSEDALTMSAGARMLAKRMGVDTVTAFEKLTGAMASGRTSQLKQLGLFVDSIKAQKDYAKANGITYSSLTDLDRAMALQGATLEALRGELENNAPPLADFGELIAQGKVYVGNLVDGLAVMISKSPPLIAGLTAIKDIIGKAFGGDQEGLILTIVNMIEKAALMAIEFGKAGITAAGFIYRGFQGIKAVVLGVAFAMTELGKKQADLVATSLETASRIPGVGAAFEGVAGMARSAADALEGVNAGLKTQVTDAMVAAAGMDSFGQGLTTATGVLDTIKESMVNAGLSQRELNAGLAEGTTNIGLFAGANTEAGESIKTSLQEWGDFFLENLDATRDKTAEWATETEAFFDGVRERGLGQFGGEMLTVGGIVQSQAVRMTEAFAAFGIQTKTEMAALVEQMEKDFEKIKESGLATDKDLAASAQALADAKAELRGEELSHTMSTHDALLGSSMEMFAALGSKFKAAAIAGAIISTYMAIAKSLGAYPWPFNLVAAAAAGVAGFMNVAKIKSSKEGMRAGTAGLDYQEFGNQTPTILHGKEAVIPQGGGHQLAAEIAAAQVRRNGAPRDDILGERFERIGSKLDSLPRAIQRAVRDGMLLAGT